MNVIGEVQGRACVLVDDIVDSAGTLCNAAEALIKNGATEVYAYVVHGVLSGGAVARIRDSQLKSLVITDSIARSEEVRNCPATSAASPSLHCWVKPCGASITKLQCRRPVRLSKRTNDLLP